MHVLAAAALLFATTTPLTLDELVKKAGENEVAQEAAFKDRPVTLTIDVKELDKKGGVKDSSEIVIRRTFVDGKPQEEIVKYVESGADITEKKKAEKQKRIESEKNEKTDEKDDDDGEIRSPFHPKLVENYAFEDLGADKTDPALRRVRFAPKKGATGEDLLTGEVTLTADAQLRETQARPATLPMLVSSVDIAAAFGDAGELRRLEMKGEAGVLFVKKRFKIVTTFDWAPK